MIFACWQFAAPHHYDHAMCLEEVLKINNAPQAYYVECVSKMYSRLPIIVFAIYVVNLYVINWSIYFDERVFTSSYYHHHIENMPLSPVRL